MKVNGSMLGGSMRRHYFPSHAEYFVKFLLGYMKEACPFELSRFRTRLITGRWKRWISQR